MATAEAPPARSAEAVRRWACALAFGCTALLGAATLLLGSFRVTTCISRPGFGGCGTRVYPFSLEAVPALIWPAALFAGLALLAAVAWRTRSVHLAGIATTAFAALATGPILVLTPWLAVPVGLLVLALPIRAGRNLRRTLIDLATALSLTALAVATAYTLLLAATLWRGGWLGAIAPAMWLYLAFAIAVAIGVGCALAVRTEEPFPLARGALVAFGVCGASGTVALAAMGEEPALKALAVRSFLLIAAVAVPLGAVALRRLLRFPPHQALAGSLLAALAFPLCTAITIGTLMSLGPGPIAPWASIGLELPRVPWLPGTSTAP